MNKYIEDLLKKININNPHLAKNVTVSYNDDNTISIINSSPKIRTINIAKLFFAKIRNKYLKFENEGILKKGGCYFSIINTTIPLNSKAELSLSLLNRYYYNITLTLKPNTEIILNKLSYLLEIKNKPEEIKSDAETLILSPGYPSSGNLYAFGFVHTSTKGYVDAGFNVDIFCYNDTKVKYQYQYQFDNSKIFCDDFVFLKNLISNSCYKRIIIHFFDEQLVDIIESVVLYYGIKIYVYVHGAEVLYRYQEKMVTSYDGVYHPYFNVYQIQLKDLILKKYSQNLNITWIFVSNWLKEEAEKIIETKFLNYFIIPNGLDTDIFKYSKKLPNHRLNIFTVRRFDNINKYALDIVIETILFLANKDFFNKLSFNIYGEGPLFKEFANKLVAFPNVKFTRGFFTHRQISELHKNCGIVFHPSRLDAMGCSSLEAVCSGLVLVSSNSTAIPEFTAPAYGTLSNDIENPASYAAIIEELYNNPSRFLELSEKMSLDISSKYSRKIILEKELALFNNEKEFYIEQAKEEKADKILSICIPAYNIESYLIRCLNSILSCSNKHLLEIIIVNDGSTDNTLNVARQYKENFPNIITIIDQENGGHGSAITVGIQNATAKYFKIIDGDDWVEPDALDKLLVNLKSFDVDVVLTEFSCDILDAKDFTKNKLYGHLPQKKVIKFEKIIFSSYGPVLATATYKTSNLKNLNLQIQKKCFYVDMEFNAYAIKNVNNAVYLNIFLYRYFIGRTAQSTSMESFRKKYQDHEKVIFNILHFVEQEPQLSKYKRKLIIDKLLVPMITTHFTNFLVHFKMYKKAFDMYKKIIFRNKAIYKVELSITLLICKIIMNSLLEPIIIVGNKILLTPYNLGKYTLQIMNKYDIYYLNDYAEIIKRILLLPHTIIHKFCGLKSLRKK